jgi:primosomal protein N'
VQLARIHNCHIILGSCSPSLESALNVRTGKYFLLDLSSQGRELHPGCRYTLVDIRAEKKKNGMQGPVSRILLAAMHKSSRTAIIRGYEKPEELEGLQADIFTIPQAAKTDLAAYDLVAMLNADALFDAGNFRSDEHACQYLERLRCICPAVIVQSAQAAHQVFSMNSSEGLMEERRVFGLPPYSRLIDLRVRDAGAAASLSEALAVSGFRVMQMPETVRVILPRDKHFTDNKKKLRKIVETFRRDSKSDVIIDVDPL